MMAGARRREEPRRILCDTSQASSAEYARQRGKIRPRSRRPVRHPGWRTRRRSPARALKLRSTVRPFPLPPGQGFAMLRDHDCPVDRLSTVTRWRIAPSNR
jgi:hypothetical protein